MDTVRVKVIPTRELFRDDDSGFKIYSADIKEREDGVEVETNNYGNISIKGNNLPDFNLGAVYDLRLSKNARDKYKGSYNMVKNYFVKPQTVDEQWKFLSMVVTENQYLDIANFYSKERDSIIDIIVNGKFDYESVRGYGEITYENLKLKVKDDLAISEALAYFSEYEIPYNTVKRLVKAYGSAEVTIQKIEENPYAIIDQNGFGFLKADDLAMKMGIEKDSIHRIRSCMKYLLEESNKNGDIWIERKKLYNKMKKLLEIEKGKIEEIMNEKNDDIFEFKDRFSTAKSARNELYISYMLAYKTKKEEPLLSKIGYDPEKFIKIFETENSITLSDKQREFLFSLKDTNVMFLIGNAGSGKSLIQKVVIRIAEELNLTYALLAPTGRASKVLSGYTERQAFTIHKKIGFGSSQEVSEISEQIILVDEASMCDVNIAQKLLSLIKEGSLVVFIGDDAQIPSVGEGNFLFDCINYDEVPKIKLDKVFRQKESGMLNAITLTRKGRAFLNTSKVGRQKIGNNFEFKHMMKEEIVDSVVSSYEKLLSKGFKFEDIGILTPTNIGDIGTVEINRRIQSVVNPQNGRIAKDEHEFGNSKSSRIIRVGDYVMNTENMYEAQVVNEAKFTDIFNGECGIVVAVNTSNKEIIVDFDGEHVLYSFSDAMKKLSHAWAVTIHKSQGSQYEAVIVVVDASAVFQLNANLLYTATSRAKSVLGIFGQARTYNRALKKFANFDRKSFLGEFLEILFSVVDSVEEQGFQQPENAQEVVKEMSELLRNESNSI